MHHHHRQPSDQSHRLRTVMLHIGGVCTTGEPIKIKTVLGSCISACLFDPLTSIGGMNHFMLPGSVDSAEDSTRYGINAMEVLINKMMSLGSNRSALQAKIFGGANIFRADHPLMMIGARNIGFIRSFLETERIPIVSHRLGGNEGLIVHYLPHRFEVLVKPVSMEKFKRTEEEELQFQQKINRDLNRHQQKNITLF
jgi:chemotaxis receptor (MCP) glutamine deamidase CheD